MSTDKNTTPTIPRRVRRIVARVQARDRAYFERHPDAWFYWRTAIPGEFSPESVPVGAPVFVLRSPTPLIRVRRCGDVIAIDAEGRAAEIADRLGPPDGMAQVDIFARDASDPQDGRP
jgi:hypothetical protein